MRQLTPIAIFLLTLVPAISNADVSMVVTGTSGSADLTLSMSGSLTYDELTISFCPDTQFMRFPTSSFWFTPTGDWSGDSLWNTRVSSQNFLATSSSLQMAISGDHSQTYHFDSIVINSLQDGWLNPSNSAFQGFYPDLTAADVVFTVSGSATFTLPGGLTFDDLNLGTRTSGYDYQGDVFQTVSTVPEPNSTTIVWIGLGLVGACRRRSRVV